VAENPHDSGELPDLLKQALAGQRQAFEELFARYRPYLCQFVELRLDPKLRSRLDPSDVVQEAQIEAFRRLKCQPGEPPMPFRLWLRQITQDRLLRLHRHHVRTARRTTGRERQLPDHSSLMLAEQLLASGPTPSEQVNRRDLAQRLGQALEQLAEGDREILLLRNFEGLSNQETGHVLGIEPATASQRHGRAMLRLHKILFAAGLTESQL
jgi:RNA polymerase sigma-70 factor (ECF subfamily)